MDWQSFMDNPTVIIVLAAVGTGLGLIWKALVAAVVRALNQLAPDHIGDDRALVAKVRRHGGRGRVDALMTTMAPGSLIEHQMKMRVSIPPEDDT